MTRSTHILRHRDGPRGLYGDLLPPALFGRMFPLGGKVTPAPFSDAALAKLGAQMSTSIDELKDEKAHASGIPALYTYFGQFVAHDLTFDPNTSLEKRRDKTAQVDYRTPAFDLDNVYGRGPEGQPYMYRSPRIGTGAERFLLGQPLNSGYNGNTDLPRNVAEPARALIADPRDDENVLIAQLHTLFLRFHNNAAQNEEWNFQQVQNEVIYHYQQVVLYDFLRRIINSKVLKLYEPGGHYEESAIRYYHWKGSKNKPPNSDSLSPYPFLPIEFSAAAYRFGHSMVRPAYQLNDDVLAAIFPDSEHLFPESLTGFQRTDPQFGLDWVRFIDIHRGFGGSKRTELTNNRPLQFAFKIDTLLSNPLLHLPPSLDLSRTNSLAVRDLIRGSRLGLPTARTIARAMGIEDQLLENEEIIIGGYETAGGTSIVKVHKEFKSDCPLWPYILAEATHYQEPEGVPGLKKRKMTPKLGPVGGRIVAETILGLMFADPLSLLNQRKGRKLTRTSYSLADFVNDALDPTREISSTIQE